MLNGIINLPAGTLAEISYSWDLCSKYFEFNTRRRRLVCTGAGRRQESCSMFLTRSASCLSLLNAQTYSTPAVNVTCIGKDQILPPSLITGLAPGIVGIPLCHRITHIHPF